MHTSALEETELPENTNEQETPEPQLEISNPPSTPEPEAAQPETQEQEVTALVSTEPEVIEGEFVEIEPLERPEAYTPPKQKPYWLLIPFAILCCLVFLAGSYLLPLLTPSATVTLVPVERSLSITTAIQVQGRQLAPLTLMVSTSVTATGKRHQDATEAQGNITFFNGLYISQTVASGTILIGNDGVQIITNVPAIIPAANPPYIGQVTISAHAISPGSQGNIPAGDINQPCCLTAVKAVNAAAFTGGQNARDYLVVTRADINNAVTNLLITLGQSEQAALQVQLHPGEALITLSCTPTVTSNHKPGDEAKKVSVIVSITCTSIAYNAHDVYQNATQMLPAEAIKQLGTGYSQLGDMQASIIHTTETDQARGIATLRVKLDATYVYQLTPGEKQQLVKLIAGKTKQQAQALLSKEPGIAGVVITTSGNAATLPENPGKITIVIAERL